MRLGWTELIIILVIVLVIFGGGKLAGFGKELGKGIREFKKEVKDDSSENSEAPLERSVASDEKKD